MTELPRLLQDFTPAEGLIKSDYEDFEVEELPLYPADGYGTHTYFLLEKRGLSTMNAAADIARALNVRRRDIGYAGLKDARAVTRQWMSLEHIEPQRLAALDIPRLRILEVTRHTNKLRLGHLKANRFTIRVRQTEPARLPELQDALAELVRRGVPNYFGEQRFGGRGDAWAVGLAMLRGHPDQALDLVLGRPSERDHGDIRRARELYERGQYAQAARRWPGMFRDERRALSVLARSGGHKPRAFAAIDKATRRFYLSACQSQLFNQIVAARLPLGLQRLQTGDLAYLHASGAVFRVEDLSLEQPRADGFEISPSGPLFGYRMTEPAGQPGELEAQLLAAQDLPPHAFRTGRLHLKGARRPLRFQPADAQIRLGAAGRGVYLELTFALPRGCYATSLLRELFATPPHGLAPETSGTETLGT
jgi:tRNA pseudouridine13 synthase